METRLSDWIRALREKRRLSQDELAQAAKAVDPSVSVAQSRISEWERGVGTPSYRQFEAIRDALKPSVRARKLAEELWKRAERGESHPPSSDEPAPAPVS